MPPPPIEVVHVQAFEKDRLVFIDRRGAIWCTFSRPLWDVLAWLWWWLTPGDKRWVLLDRERQGTGRVRATRIRAVCLSRLPLRMGTG